MRPETVTRLLVVFAYGVVPVDPGELCRKVHIKEIPVTEREWE